MNDRSSIIERRLKARRTFYAQIFRILFWYVEPISFKYTTKNAHVCLYGIEQLT